MVVGHITIRDPLSTSRPGTVLLSSSDVKEMALKVAQLRRKTSGVKSNVDVVVVEIGVRRGGRGGGGGGNEIFRTLQKIREQLQSKKVRRLNSEYPERLRYLT